MNEAGIERFKAGAVALSTAIRERLGLIHSPTLGEVVAFDVGGLLYTLDGGGELLAVRQRAGRMEWGYVDAGGEVGPWRMQAPSSGQAAQN